METHRPLRNSELGLRSHYLDFRQRRIWLSCQTVDGLTSISCSPIRFRQFLTLAEWFGWRDHWVLVFGFQKRDVATVRQALEAHSIDYRPMGTDRFLVRWVDAHSAMTGHYWSVWVLALPNFPDADQLSYLSTKPLFIPDFDQHAFSELGAAVKCGINMFDVHAAFRVCDPGLASELWQYLISSHLISQQLVSVEYAQRCAANLPMVGWGNQHLLYWGHTAQQDDITEFVYLLTDPNALRAPAEWVYFSEHSEPPGFRETLPSYRVPEEATCVVLNDQEHRRVQFAEARKSVMPSVSPALIGDHKWFVWGMTARPKGYVFHLEPFRFRDYVDALCVDGEAQVFYHPHVSKPICDASTHEPAPFWLQAPARESFMYGFYEDITHRDQPLEEFDFVLTGPDMGRAEIESRLGTDEDAPWVSYDEFFGTDGCAPPMERFGCIWDEHVSGIYLERPSDIQRLIGYTIWSLFKEHFDRFPGTIPDGRFSDAVLDYFVEMGTAVLIEQSDFWREGVEYLARIHSRPSRQERDLPREQQVWLLFLDGEWRLIRRP